jgi:hypothetical protein
MWARCCGFRWQCFTSSPVSSFIRVLPSVRAGDRQRASANFSAVRDGDFQMDVQLGFFRDFAKPLLPEPHCHTYTLLCKVKIRWRFEDSNMELHEALTQISVIRHQLARSERFHGYRAAPAAASGLLACLAGLGQSQWISDAMLQLDHYLILWFCVALISLITCWGDVWWRYRGSRGDLRRETTHLALEQFFPCLVAGGLLTVVIFRFARDVAWMLPGLWAIAFSLGLFASWRLLPAALFAVAFYFLAGGTFALTWAATTRTLSPWTMPLLFGVGQFASAAVLLLSERNQPSETK